MPRGTKQGQIPTLHFFRATPKELLQLPPLASSLQSFETFLFMIALQRFPAALVSCASAWESAIKAKLGITPEAFVSLAKLLEQIRGDGSFVDTFDEAKLKAFRDARNRVVHYGFSPKDDELCTIQLLETGIPFLFRCYEEYFDFYPDWRDISPRRGDFHELSPAEMEKVGLVPEFSQQLNYALAAYNLAQQQPGVRYICYFNAFIHFLKGRIAHASRSASEAESLELSEFVGEDYHIARRRKSEVEAAYGNQTWEFDCPVCYEFESIVAQLDVEVFDEKRVSVKGLMCVKCDLVLHPKESILANVILQGQLQEKRDAILKEYGCL